MRRNYKVSEHRIYHAWRRTVDCTSEVVGTTCKVVWQGFLRPVLVLTVGVGLAFPFAHIASRVLERIIQ